MVPVSLSEHQVACFKVFAGLGSCSGIRPILLDVSSKVRRGCDFEDDAKCRTYLHMRWSQWREEMGGNCFVFGDHLRSKSPRCVLFQERIGYLRVSFWVPTFPLGTSTRFICDYSVKRSDATGLTSARLRVKIAARRPSRLFSGYLVLSNSPIHNIS